MNARKNSIRKKILVVKESELLQKELEKTIFLFDSSIDKLEKMENSLQSKSDFNMGLFYGLFMGLVTNLYVSMIYTTSIVNFSNELKKLIFSILSIVIFGFILIFMYEHKRTTKEKEAIRTLIKETRDDINKLEQLKKKTL